MNEFRFMGHVTDSIDFLIDNNIPIPKGLCGDNTSRLREALTLMEVGQSTTVPVNPETGRALVRIGNALRGVEGKEFTQRVVIENSVKLVRVWRTA